MNGSRTWGHDDGDDDEDDGDCDDGEDWIPWYEVTNETETVPRSVYPLSLTLFIK